MLFIKAKNYTRVGVRKIDLIVIHDMESPEGLDTAENVASWAAGASAPRASWHYAVDTNSVVQSVRDMDVAWHAPGANHNGLGIEHAGRARQSSAEWMDPYSRGMLALSALLVADLCKKYDIPPVFIDAAGLKAGKRGITTHAQVTLAFKRGTHTDPGPNFPMWFYLSLVREALKPKLLRNWPVPLPKWWWAWNLWKQKGGKRPVSAPFIIPPWAWARRRAFLAARAT